MPSVGAAQLSELSRAAVVLGDGHLAVVEDDDKGCPARRQRSGLKRLATDMEPSPITAMMFFLAGP